jgi:hypothetical protein
VYVHLPDEDHLARSTLQLTFSPSAPSNLMVDTFIANADPEEYADNHP